MQKARLQKTRMLFAAMSIAVQRMLPDPRPRVQLTNLTLLYLLNQRKQVAPGITEAPECNGCNESNARPKKSLLSGARMNRLNESNTGGRKKARYTLYLTGATQLCDERNVCAGSRSSRDREAGSMRSLHLLRNAESDEALMQRGLGLRCVGCGTGGKATVGTALIVC